MTSHQQTFSLFKAIIIALIVAIIVLVLFILPAEYDIDITGSGTALGLTAFSDTTQHTNKELIKENITNQDLIQLTVPKGRGIEYKLHMDQFEEVTYDWSTDSGLVYVDLHGEPKGDTTGYFKSYTIATAERMNGSFVAPFDGVHGWYWKNKTDQDVVITLKFEGVYSIKGLIQ